MSEHEWEPGDVAMVNGDVCVRMHTGQWEHGRGNHFPYPPDSSDVFPVAVIPYEDREQVERLANGLRDGIEGILRVSINDYDLDRIADRLQAALRGLANPTPPKPEEPQGLGAVVEDAEGADWHRTRDGRWIAEDGLRSRAAGWGHIDAVRVLSEGVR